MRITENESNLEIKVAKITRWWVKTKSTINFFFFFSTLMDLIRSSEIV